MVFSSPVFLYLFLPVCLIVYLIINAICSIKIKNICLLIFSIIFYAYGSLSFLPILIVSIIINFILSKVIDGLNKDRNRTIIFAITIIFNVSLLFIYKYLNLFTGFFLGKENATNIVLPIGISFYTFQVLSYIVDVYRRDVKSSDSIIDFALFVMLFPQLIAGPIVRYSCIEKELKNRTTTINSFGSGILRFMIGFSKKILLANALGKIADLAFKELGLYTMGTLLSCFVLVCYSIQIYLDFWAYSEMAIGLGEIFGFTFPNNFNTPFISKSITEFWNRWHITLSTFFKDYVYIPLGGSRKGLVRTCLNLTIVFMLSGFWHGASFNFLFWGLFNAFFLVIERIIKVKFKISIPDTFGIVYVFIVWNIGMILFRLESIESIKLYLIGFFSKPIFNTWTRELINEIFTPYFIICFIISILYLTPLFGRIKIKLETYKYGFVIVDALVILLFMFSTVVMLTEGFNPFIYFRF